MSTGDQSDMFGRLKSLLPAGWFGDSNPIRDALLWGYAQALAWGYTLYLYAKAQTRIKTASDGFLDLIGLDFFGNNLIRSSNQSDASYRNRILINIFRERTTRHAMEKVLLDLTGRKPIIIEPARPADVGAYGAAVAVSQPGTTTMIDNGKVVYVPPNTARYQGGQLLIEPQRANLATKSEALSVGLAVTIASDTTVAPDGNMTADLVQETSAAGEHFANDISQAVSIGDTYTWSVFVKDGPSANRNLYLRLATAVTSAITFNPRTQAISGSANATFGFTALSSGWFRVWITVTMTATANLVARLQLNNGSTSGYTGDGTSGLYMWGRQLELGASPTSYIPTASTTVTSAADILLNNMPTNSAAMGGYAAAGAYGSLSLSYQAFITAYRPNSQGLPFVAGYGISTGGYATPSRSDYAQLSQGDVTDADIYAAIDATKPYGSVAWTQILS